MAPSGPAAALRDLDSPSCTPWRPGGTKESGRQHSLQGAAGAAPCLTSCDGFRCSSVSQRDRRGPLALLESQTSDRVANYLGNAKSVAEGKPADDRARKNTSGRARGPYGHRKPLPAPAHAAGGLHSGLLLPLQTLGSIHQSLILLTYAVAPLARYASAATPCPAILLSVGASSGQQSSKRPGKSSAGHQQRGGHSHRCTQPAGRRQRSEYKPGYSIAPPSTHSGHSSACSSHECGRRADVKW